jgi:hypothetical protein
MSFLFVASHQVSRPTIDNRPLTIGKPSLTLPVFDGRSSMVDGLTRGCLFYLTVNSADRQSAIPAPFPSPIRVEYAMEIQK